MGRTSREGASSGLSGAAPVSARGDLGGEVSRGRRNGGSKSSSGTSRGDAIGERGGERPIDIEVETRRSAEGDTISLGVVGRGLRVAGEMRLSAAEGGSEKDAELLGERSPPPDPSEEAARECEVREVEVGTLERDADSGWPFQRNADEALEGVRGMIKPTGRGGTGFAVTMFPRP